MVSRLAGHQISFHMNVVQWHAERDDDDDCGKELTECRVSNKRFLRHKFNDHVITVRMWNP